MHCFCCFCCSALPQPSLGRKIAWSRSFPDRRPPLGRIGTPALDCQSVLDLPDHIPAPIEGRKAKRWYFGMGTMAESSQQMIILAAVQPVATRHRGVDF